MLVPTDAPGITITPMKTVDLTRRFSVVRFDGVRVHFLSRIHVLLNHFPNCRFAVRRTCGALSKKRNGQEEAGAALRYQAHVH